MNDEEKEGDVENPLELIDPVTAWVILISAGMVVGVLLACIHFLGGA